MNIDRFWVWIVIKDSEYLQCAINGRPKWSVNRSDAAPINFYTDALAVAEKVGGEVRRMNTITQSMI